MDCFSCLFLAIPCSSDCNCVYIMQKECYLTKPWSFLEQFIFIDLFFQKPKACAPLCGSFFRTSITFLNIWPIEIHRKSSTTTIEWRKVCALVMDHEVGLHIPLLLRVYVSLKRQKKGDQRPIVLAAAYAIGISLNPWIHRLRTAYSWSCLHSQLCRFWCLWIFEGLWIQLCRFTLYSAAYAILLWWHRDDSTGEKRTKSTEGKGNRTSPWKNGHWRICLRSVFLLLSSWRDALHLMSLRTPSREEEGRVSIRCVKAWKKTISNFLSCFIFFEVLSVNKFSFILSSVCVLYWSIVHDSSKRKTVELDCFVFLSTYFVIIGFIKGWSDYSIEQMNHMSLDKEENDKERISLIFLLFIAQKFEFP